jgi:excisionase family DNA binding protein
MARHKLVTIVPGEQLLTTQQAADRLAISRPTLIQLLADGQIPYEYRGHHRRVALAEILAYEQRKPRRHPGRLNVRAGR